MKQFERFRAGLPPALRGPRIWAPLALAAISAGCLFYWFGLRAPRSIQAFVNTGVIVMRAPVAGQLTLTPAVRIGRELARGERFGSIAADIENPRMSQLRIQAQELGAREDNLRAQIAGVDATLREKRRQLARYQRESGSQRALQIAYGQAQLNTARQEYQRSAIAAGSADREAGRARRMYANGFISAAALEKMEASERDAAAAVGVQQAHVAQSELGLRAYTAGLQLDGPRTFSEPDSKVRELDTGLVELEQQANNLARALLSTHDELARVRQELASLASVALAAPKAGVIWSITAQPGENVGGNNEILHLVSCDNVWVEAFFDEADIGGVKAGDPVEVRMLHGAERWGGHVETVRSGAGRVSVGQYVVDPPPEIARRQLPVRVATLRVRVDWKGTLSPASFCHAGSSVRVVLG